MHHLKQNIYFKTLGQGQPMMLLHGLGFTHEAWSPILPKLINDFEIILLDLPGFGQSDDMSFERFHHAITERLRHHHSPVILVGWSLGGLYALKMALNTPLLFSKLIQVASTPYFIKTIKNDKLWPGISPRRLRNFRLGFEHSPQKTLQQFIELQSPNPINSNKITLHNPNKKSLLHGLEQLKNWDLREAIEQLKLPTSYWFGRHDAIVPIQTYHTMRKQYPHLNYLVFEGAGHMPFLSHTDAFVDALKGI